MRIELNNRNDKNILINFLGNKVILQFVKIINNFKSKEF